MARVIHRRKSPPYALIIFVFLFLVAATLAVIALNKLQTAQADLGDTNAVIEILAGTRSGQGQYPQLKVGLASTLYDHEKKELDKARKKSPNAKVKVPVLAELMARESALREMITNKAPTKVEAERIVTALRSDINDHGPLVSVINKFRGQVAERDKKIVGLGNDLDQAEQKRKSFEDQANQLQNKLKALSDAKDAEIAKLDKDLKKYQADQAQKLREAQQKWDDNLTDKDGQVAKLAEQVARLTKDKNDLTLQLDIEKKKSRPRPGAPDVVSLALRPDGKVLRVLRGENICYVGLGSKDRAIPGLTFSVYPAGKGPHTNTPSKASITVINVADSSLSECRIDKVENPEHPVVAGDEIANVAFDATRKFSFVVEGEFNLYGRRGSSSLATKQIKALITKFGGQVLDELTPETDFAVMGSPPIQPGKPKEDAEDSEKVVYEEQMKIHKKYSEVRDKAVKMHIPVLNTNRFLALVGYTPTKTLK